MCGAIEEIRAEVLLELQAELNIELQDLRNAYAEELRDLDLNYIRIIMKKQNLGAEGAMDYLRIPPEKQERYLSLLSTT